MDIETEDKRGTISYSGTPTEPPREWKMMSTTVHRELPGGLHELT